MANRVARSDALAEYIASVRPTDPKLWDQQEVIEVLSASPDLEVHNVTEDQMVFWIPGYRGFVSPEHLHLSVPEHGLSLRYDGGTIYGYTDRTTGLLTKQQIQFNLEGLTAQGPNSHLSGEVVGAICKALTTHRAIEVWPYVLRDLPEDRPVVKRLQLTATTIGNTRYPDQTVDYECFASEADDWVARWQGALAKESKQLAALRMG